MKLRIVSVYPVHQRLNNFKNGSAVSWSGIYMHHTEINAQRQLNQFKYRKLKKDMRGKGQRNRRRRRGRAWNRGRRIWEDQKRSSRRDWWRRDPPRVCWWQSSSSPMQKTGSRTDLPFARRKRSVVESIVYFMVTGPVIEPVKVSVSRLLGRPPVTSNSIICQH